MCLIHRGKRFFSLPANRKIFGVLLIVEVFYLFYSVCLFLMPRAEYLYSGQGLVSKYGIYLENFLGEYGNGYYLDNSIHPDETDLAAMKEGEDESVYWTIKTPPVDLHRGSYEITVSYQCQDTQKYSVSADYDTYPVIAGRQSVDFSPRDTEFSFSLYAPIRVEGYQVQTNYRGNGYLFVSSISIRETDAWKRVNLVIALLVFLLVDAAFLIQLDPVRRLNPSGRTAACALFLISLFASAPVLNFYLGNGHDLNFHLYRIEALKNALLGGQFPARVPFSWCNGYGYATSIFYGELFLYVPAVLRMIGFTVQDSYKIYLICINLAGSLICYFCFFKMLRSRLTALLGCAVYILSPYRLLCLYVRAAVGEYTAMTFLPLIIYGLWRIFTEETDSEAYKKSWLPAVLGFSGLIQSHVITCVLAGLFTVILCVILIRRTFSGKRFAQLLKVVCYTVLFNLWFLVPFLDYMRFDYNAMALSDPGRFGANGVSLSELLSLFPVGAGSSYTVADYLSAQNNEMPFTLGAAMTAAGAFYLLYRLYCPGERSAGRRLGDFVFGMGALALFMSTIYFPWDFVQQLGGPFGLITQNIQFPWRFLGIASALFALLTGCLLVRLWESKNKSLLYTASASVVLLALLSGGYLMSSYSLTAAPRYIQEENDTSSYDIMLGEYLPAGTDTTIFYDTAPESEGRLTDLTYTKENGVMTISCRNDTETETYVDASFLYYKGYAAKDLESGEKLSVVRSDKNKVRVIVPAGYSGSFYVRFEEPWYWRGGELISLICLFALIVSPFIKRKSTMQTGAVPLIL